MELNQALKQELQMTRKSLQKGLIFLAIKEVESNATLRLSLTPFRMDIIKTEMRTNTGIIWGNGSPYILLVGVQLRIVTLEVSLEVQKNNKQNSRSTILSSATIPKHEL